MGSLPALIASITLVLGWALTGPLFNFSDTWQLFINTTTTVVTFWMVFVIQNSANRSAKATQLKLDEIIRAIEGARNEFITLDKATDSVLTAHEEEFDRLTAETDLEPAASDSPSHAPGRPVAAAGGRRSPGRSGAGTPRAGGSSRV